MTNWNNDTSQPSLYLREEEIRRGMELLYFAYRDFTAAADEMLAQSGYGRAHHRVLYFVGRHPGTSVSGLLDLLNITKQSLSRVLNQLVADGYIIQEKGTQDRRQRLLYLTEKGETLEKEIFYVQKDKIAKAYRRSGGDSVAGFWDVLLHIVDADNRDAILKRVK